MDKEFTDGTTETKFTKQQAYCFEEYQKRGVPIELVDTTGAGDSFTGAFAVAMLEGKSTQESL